MQEFAQISLSPFGRRTLSPGVLKINSLVRECPAGTPAQKWKVFRDISAARATLGVPDRALIVLNALMSFHPDAVLTAGSADLVVFPSNRHLSLRSHGMAASTLRRHLTALVDHGLILRRDSPNGKRYARKSADGDVEIAYGFDLGPIVARAAEFDRLARRIEEEAQAVRDLRQRFTVLRRDVVKMIAAGVEAGIAIDWPGVHGKYQAIVSHIPRTPTAAALTSAAIELQDLANYILDVLDTHLGEPAATPATPADVDASTNTAPQILTLRPRTMADDPDRGRRTDRREAVPLRVVLDACPDIIDYARGEIHSYRELLTTAALVRPLLGVSPSAWEEAGQVMGEMQASIVVAAILQRGIAIKNPGGYLRNLTRRAADGQFSIWPMLLALSATRLKKAT